MLKRWAAMDYLRLAITASVGAANIGIALAVFLRNRRQPANRAFAAAMLMIVAWFTLAFLSDQTAFLGQALILNRLTFAAALLMGACLLYLATVFPRAHGPAPLGHRVYLAIGVLLSLATAFTPLMVGSVVPADWGTNVVDGPLIWAMTWWLAGATLIAGVGLTLKYRRVEGHEKAQLKYFFLGLVMFAIAALMLGMVLPLATGSWRLSTLNSFSSLLLAGFTSYAMVKHRLMDIRLVVLRGSAYTLFVLLLGSILVAVALAARAELTGRLGLSSDVIFVGTSLAAILAFQSLRRGLEHLTDSIFFRKTYDPQALITELGASMATTLDLNDLEWGLSRNLCSGMRLTRVAIAHVRAGEIEVVGAPEGFISAEELHSLIGGLDGALIFADGPDTDPDVSRLLERLRIRAFVPLVREGEALGAILLGAKLSGEMFTTQDAQFLENLGREGTIAFHNALLFEERNQRVRELSSLSALAGTLGGDSRFELILDGVLDEVMEVTDAESGSIMLVQPDGETLTIESARGLSQKVVESTRIRLGEGIAGWVAQHLKPLMLVDARDDGFGCELEREGIRSALSVPLIRKGSVMGVLNLARAASGESFNDENLKVVASFAGQLAVAIENSKLSTDVSTMFDSLEQTRRQFDETQDFFAKASHELRTPLNSIIGFSTMLRTGMAGQLSDEQRRQVDMINVSGKRLLALVNDLLDLQKLTTQQISLDISSCDIDAAVIECVNLLEPMASEKGLYLIVDDAGAGAIQADGRRVEQAILNLIGNAVKFTDEGYVRVRTTRGDEYVGIEISDSGCGIAPDLLPRVFEEFISRSSATNSTGLGLAITHQVAERHGGLVTVSSEEGVGSTFELRLPISTAEIPAPRLDPNSQDADSKPSWGHLRAL